MPSNTTRPSIPASSDRSLPALAAGAIALWVVLEVALRRGLGPRLADLLGTGLGADAVILALAFPVIAAAVAWWGRRVGVAPSDWTYDVSVRSVGAGLAGAAAFFAVYVGVAAVYTTVLGLQPSLGAGALGVADAPTWALALFVLGNGVVVPISEELAWRGVVQTALTESYGTHLAVVVTAVAFVAKHLVVDLAAPLFRVTSLAMLAFVFGGLRARYGTASSTVAHLLVNGVTTAALVLA